MTVNAWLKDAVIGLEAAGIGTARLDCLVLLEDVTGIDRAALLARPEHELSSGNLTKLKNLLTRRAGHEPLAYIRGHSEFYGRDFVITPAVLEPRPESETMIDLLGELSAAGDLSVKSALGGDIDLHLGDVGAGSGALGITAKLEFPKALNVQVDLLEIDPKALKVAQSNVEKFTLNIRVIQSDLLEHSSQDYDLLLCNLPYVPDGHTVNQAAMREPKIAIFGGPDGLDIYRQLFRQVSSLPKQPLYILTESLPPQHVVLADIAKRHGYELNRSEDFIQVFKL